MKGKILSFIIMIVIVLGSFGVVGTNVKTESSNYCVCSDYYYHEENSDIGDNAAAQYPLENICGLIVPEGWENNAHFEYFDTSTLGSLPSFYDVRRTNPEDKNSNFISNFPPAKNQGNCGSCWAFATVGVLEINIRLKEGLTVDLSEQYLVSCNTNGWGCGGGWWAHDYHEWKEGKLKDGVGAVMEADFEYVSGTGYVPACKPCEHEYLIKDWAFIGSQSGIPSVSDIKQAIMNYGSVSVAVCSDSFSGYSGGVFDKCSSGDINHAVVLVGWDDSQGTEGVWFMRNSWGTGWGEDGGYMRIPYGCSSIGYSACYVVYQPEHTIGKRPLDVTIHKISDHPDDGDFEPIDALDEPEWYYRVGANVDGDAVYHYNYNRDHDGWWIFAWNDAYRWTPDEVHHLYVDDLSEEVTIKLMDWDVIPKDDLADVSAYPGGGEQDGAEHENRGAIYHGTYNLKTNTLTGDTTGTDGGYYTTIGDGDENAKVWFKIYDPVMADAGGPYNGLENVDITFNGEALQYSGTAPYNYHWDFGDGSTSNQQNPTHKYNDGSYTATLTITDNKGDSSKAYTDVTVHANTAPEKPSISGPSSGSPRTEYSFTFTATDPEGTYGDKISYGIDWGDGSEIEWTEFVSSGIGVTKKHTWASRDSFTIKAKAKDLNGKESEWATKTFSTPKNKTTSTPLMRFLYEHQNLFQLLKYLFGKL